MSHARLDLKILLGYPGTRTALRWLGTCPKMLVSWWEVQIRNIVDIPIIGFSTAPKPWLPLYEVSNVNVAAQRKRESSLWNTIAALNKMRDTSISLTEGSSHFPHIDENVFSIVRYTHSYNMHDTIKSFFPLLVQDPFGWPNWIFTGLEHKFEDGENSP